MTTDVQVDQEDLDYARCLLEDAYMRFQARAEESEGAETGVGNPAGRTELRVALENAVGEVVRNVRRNRQSAEAVKVLIADIVTRFAELDASLGKGWDSDYVTEFGMNKAEEGAATLSSMLRGLKDAAPPGATTTVVGHSYGSTTAFLAVGTAEEDLGVDRLVAVGSAGVPTSLYLAQREHGPERTFADPLPQLEFDGVDIYASRAPGDVVGWFGQLSSAGHTESPESYPGATTFDSDGGWVPSLEDTKKKEWAVATPGHASHDGANSFPWEGGQKGNGYLTRDSESFRNLANIVATGEPIS